MANSAESRVQRVNYIRPQPSLIKKTKENLAKRYIERQNIIPPKIPYFPEQKTEDIERREIECLFNYKTSDFWEDSEKVLLARMLLGEGESCSKIEKIAIAWTAINRANDNQEWNGKTLKEAILKPYQYSCFNKEYNQSLKNPLAYNPKEFYECLYLSERILAGGYKDPTKGATFYYNPGKIKTPRWVKGLERVGRIGKSYHVFYREKKKNFTFPSKNVCEKNYLPKNNRL